MLPGPQRIVCLTEETTEWLYLLGQESRIVGISGYTVRPRRARHEKPKRQRLPQRQDRQDPGACSPTACWAFRTCRPTLPAALIRHGVQVTVFNQRSVAEIFSMLFQVAAMVGRQTQGLHSGLLPDARSCWPSSGGAPLHCHGRRRPRVFFEEWDTPHISAIRWVSELIGIAGGDDCFPELARDAAGQEPHHCRRRRDRLAATPTSSWAPGVARNSGPRKWPGASRLGRPSTR